MQAAVQAWRTGDFKTARLMFKDSLDDGNIWAAWYLGHMYRRGLGVAHDRGKAFGYYRRVTQSVDLDRSPRRRLVIVVDALVRVADGYRTGIKSANVPADPRRAYSMYMTASEYLHPGADHGLALILLKGQGVRKNPTWALKWLRSAARKGHIPAKAKLGEFHWQGKYVRHDRRRAMMWYYLVKQGDRPSVYPRLYKRLNKRFDAATEDERQAGQAMAVRWMELHAPRK